MPSPIYNSIRLMRFAVAQALAARTTRGVYWLEAPGTAQRPFIVFQSQDAGGRADRKVGDLGWDGLVVVKAKADTIGAAEQLMETVAPGMDGLAAPIGYTISAAYDKPIVISLDGDIHQAAHQWRVSLHRSS